MHPFVILLNLAGAIMLLLWAVRMVRTGVERAYGTTLKNTLRGAKRGYLGIALAGAILAVVLQSSTAVGVLTAGFAATGILSTGLGIAALLGADFGSALVVKILSFDLSWLVPFLFLVGATLFLKFEARTIRQLGRIILGVAFIILSLGMVGSATEPLRESVLLPQFIGYLRDDVLTAFALAALLAWAMHSSVATVLLFVAFAGKGLLPMEVALPMILGANLGGAIIPVWLTRNMSEKARRIPLGNLLFRGVAAIITLLAIISFELPLRRLGSTPGAAAVNFHLLFNGLLVLLALPLVDVVQRLVTLLLPDNVPARNAESLIGQPASALDRATLNSPALAIASAKRELLRMGETVETMYSPVMDLLDGGDLEQIARIRALDEQVNRRHSDIKLFIAETRRGTLTDDEVRRGIEVTDFAINLEHIGDLIAKTLLKAADKKARHSLEFSPEGLEEMCTLHARVQANMQMALNVLISGDIESARQLATEKEEMRRLERDSHERHLTRLQSGNPESIETSDMHLEIVRALKEINSLLVSITYPILTESGHLLQSRLTRAG